MKETVKVFKALADPARLRILMLLRQGELCVCQLMPVLKLHQSHVSWHLSVLKRAGLITDRRDGRWVYYSLCCPDITVCLRKCINDLAKDEIVRQDRASFIKCTHVGPGANEGTCKPRKKNNRQQNENCCE